jgi:hypothetical protein
MPVLLFRLRVIERITYKGLTERIFSQFGLERGIIVDTLTDFKCKMRENYPVKCYKLFF